jgi:hypothetical protein
MAGLNYILYGIEDGVYTRFPYTTNKNNRGHVYDITRKREILKRIQEGGYNTCMEQDGKGI